VHDGGRLHRRRELHVGKHSPADTARREAKRRQVEPSNSSASFGRRVRRPLRRLVRRCGGLHGRRLLLEQHRGVHARRAVFLTTCGGVVRDVVQNVARNGPRYSHRALLLPARCAGPSQRLGVRLSFFRSSQLSRDSNDGWPLVVSSSSSWERHLCAGAEKSRGEQGGVSRCGDDRAWPAWRS
jgi:hypothetical protein